MSDGIERRATRTGLAVALAVFLADFASKWLVINRLELPQVGQLTLTPFFNLTWVQNYGVSGGFLLAQSDLQRWLLVALTGAIAAGVAVWLWREQSRVEAAALGLVLGGAIGNILDRVRFGYVADFLDLHIGGWQPFLVFNVADAAISVGVVLLILRSVFGRKESGLSEKSNA